jgi:hypothetical protein
VEVQVLPVQLLIDPDRAEFLSGEFLVLTADDYNSKHMNWNYRLITVKRSFLYDYANVNIA